MRALSEMVAVNMLIAAEIRVGKCVFCDVGQLRHSGVWLRFGHSGLMQW